MAFVRKIGRLVAVKGVGTPHTHQLRPAVITVVGVGTLVTAVVKGGETYALLPQWSRSTPGTLGWIRG